MSALISVIVPAYNAEPYLETCLNSLLAQTYRETEVILVDDGSTDNSGRLCDAFARKDARLRVLHKENGGASSARNAGLCAATGKYVYFLDSDDRVVPEFLEKLLDSAETNGSDLVFFDAYTVDERTGAISGENYSHKEQYPPDTGQKLMEKMVANGDFHMGICLQFFRKSLLDEAKLEFSLNVFAG